MLLKGIFAEHVPYRKFLILVGLTLIFAIIFTVLGSFISAALYGLNILTDPNVLNDLHNPAVASSMKLIQLFSSLGTFVLPPVIAAYLFDGSPANYLKTNVRISLPLVATVILLLIVSIPFINWMLEWNSAMHLPASMKSIEDWMKASETQAGQITDLFMNDISYKGLFLNLIIIALLPAIGEEFLFRGVIQRLFKEMGTSIHASIILTAILFSALHMQFFGFFPRFALGVLLGYLMYWSGSIRLPIAAHFTNNALAVIFGWLAARHTLPFDPDKLGTLQGQELILGSSVFLSWGLIFLLRKQTIARI